MLKVDVFILNKQFSCKVLALHLKETLSTLFEGVVLVQTNDPLQSFKEWLGQPIVLQLKDEESSCYRHGLLVKIEQKNPDPSILEKEKFYYQLYFGPLCQTLSFNKHFRIFNDMSCSEIIFNILNVHGIDFSAHLSRSIQKKRAHCIQYGESDFHFIRRIMDEEGIFFYYDHFENGQKLVLVDNNQYLLNRLYTLKMRQTETSVQQKEKAIDSFLKSSSMGPSSFKAYGYCDFKPSQILTDDLPLQGQGGAIETYISKTSSRSSFLHHVNIEAEKEVCFKEYFDGTSTSHHLEPGIVLKIQGEEDQLYLIYSVEHRYASDARIAVNDHLVEQGYGNTFQAIPFDVPYHHFDRFETPKIHSVLNGIVVEPDVKQDVPSHKTSYCDEKGRVCVQFFWQPHSSNTIVHGKNSQHKHNKAFLRVSQNFAGKGFGTMMLPRPGMEVLIGFLNGHIDDPFIIGCLYNDENWPSDLLSPATSHVGIVTNSMQHNGRGHEIILSDEAYAEKISIKSTKDFDLQIKGEMRTAIKQNRKAVIQKGNDTLFLDQGDYFLSASHGTITLKADSIRLEASKNFSISCDQTFSIQATNFSVSAQEIHMETGNFQLKALSVITITAGVTIQMDFPGKTSLFPMT